MSFSTFGSFDFGFEHSWLQIMSSTNKKLKTKLHIPEKKKSYQAKQYAATVQRPERKQLDQQTESCKHNKGAAPASHDCRQFPQ